MAAARLLGARNRPLLLLLACLLAMAAIASRPLLSKAGGDVTVFDVRAFVPITLPAGAGLPDAAKLALPHSGAEGAQQAKDAPRPVATLAAATTAVGFTPRLPAGVGAPAAIYVSTARSDKHTFTAAEVDKALAGAGLKAPQVAALLDGSTAVLDLPAAAGMVWGTTKNPTLALVESPSPTLTLAGASAATLRQALLAANGLSPAEQSLDSQLLAIDDWQHTLPVPLPPGATATAEPGVPGGHGLLIRASSDGHALSLLLWRAGGLVYALAEQGTTYDLVKLAGTIG